jgi:stage V sporulation protein B
LKVKNKFILNGIILTFTSLILKSIGMGFSIYISNKIGSKATGTFELVMSVYMFFVTFALSGINLACTRIVSEELAFLNIANIKEAMHKCILFSLFFGCLSSLFLCILAPYLANVVLHNQVSSLPFYAISISLPFVAMSSCINGYFTAVRKISKIAIIHIFEQIIKIIFVSYLINMFMPNNIDFTIISLVLGTSISEALSFFALYFIYIIGIKNLQTSRNYSSSLTKKILHISMPVAVTSYIRSGLSSIKQILIPISLEQAGLSCSDALSFYGMINGMALTTILFPNIIINAFSGLLIPEFSSAIVKKQKKEIIHITKISTKFTFLFSIIILTVLYIFSYKIATSLFNEPNLEKYIKILSPLVIFMYLDNVIDCILKGLDEQKRVMQINILDLLSTICLILFFLPHSGKIGYIVILYISEILNFTLSSLVLCFTLLENVHK